MQNNQDAIREAMRLANTPAGKQLLALLRQGQENELQQVIQSASSGDYNQARQALSRILDTPEAQKLLEQMGGSHGSIGR